MSLINSGLHWRQILGLADMFTFWPGKAVDATSIEHLCSQNPQSAKNSLMSCHVDHKYPTFPFSPYLLAKLGHVSHKACEQALRPNIGIDSRFEAIA